MTSDHLEQVILAEEFRLRRVPKTDAGDPTFLPIYLTGGMGDALLSTATLEFFRKKNIQMIVYSQHSEALKYFYKQIPIHQGDIPVFSWSLHMDSIAQFKFTKRFSGFFIDEHRAMFERQMHFLKKDPALEFLVENHPKHKFILTKKAKELGVSVVEFPLYSLGYKMFEPLPKKTRAVSVAQITIHDGFDGNNASLVSGRCTKTWKWQHWNELVRLLKKSYPNHTIIQLGSKTSRPIDGVDVDLINKTTITEAFDFIKRSEFHIDTDSGLAHAATMLSIPTVVLFGPTPIDFYGHKQNINLQSKAKCSGGCFFLQENWMDKCPIGYQSPLCMDEITPDQVIDSMKHKAPGIF